MVEHTRLLVATALAVLCSCGIGALVWHRPLLLTPPGSCVGQCDAKTSELEQFRERIPVVHTSGAPTFHQWNGCPSSRHKPLHDSLEALGWRAIREPSGNVSMYFQCSQCCQSGKCCRNHRGSLERHHASHSIINRIGSPASRGTCITGCQVKVASAP